jgi:hypothetical protein
LYIGPVASSGQEIEEYGFGVATQWYNVHTKFQENHSHWVQKLKGKYTLSGSMVII